MLGLAPFDSTYLLPTSPSFVGSSVGQEDEYLRTYRFPTMGGRIRLSELAVIQQRVGALSGDDYMCFRKSFAPINVVAWYQLFDKHVSSGKLAPLAHQAMRVDTAERLVHGDNAIRTLRFHGGWLRLPPTVKYALIKSDYLRRNCRRQGSFYATRVGWHYCAIGIHEGDAICWFWIGQVGQYDRIVENGAFSETDVGDASS
jgi:hypothetical protein